MSNTELLQSAVPPNQQAGTQSGYQSAESIAATIDGRVTLRTFILIRWIVVLGQLATILIIQFHFGLDFPFWHCLATVGASALLNIVALIQRGLRARLSERIAAMYLGYDIIQLTLLLYLTGGIQNPFCVMFLAPISVAATVLARPSVVALVILTLFATMILSFVHWPLPGMPPGFAPNYFYFNGLWIAISVSILYTATYVWSIALESRRIFDALVSSQLALEREQRLASLGALAAAAAHELGSPLGTISVVAKELYNDVEPDSPMADDLKLLVSQSERCRKILAELSRSPDTRAGGEPFDQMTISALLEEAGNPHVKSDIKLNIYKLPSEGAEPLLRRHPGMIHGLGNLIQNAIQFAKEEVVVELSWDNEHLDLRINDDGPGYTSQLLSRIGEPYISSRSHSGNHMGLGIFIAQNLLERTGAELTFGNGENGGAQIEVSWERPIDNHEVTPHQVMGA